LKEKLKYLILFLLILILAIAARFLRLDLRPMHTDEAVHGLKFGELLENGAYRYDRTDYHGPTLNYFTLIHASLRRENLITEIDERLLRSVPAFFGVALLALMLLLAGSLGRRYVLISAIFIALSPQLVFYSRYYIQEILLVFFNAALIISLFRYFLKPSYGWAIAAGVSAGLMAATKETWVIFAVIQALTLASIIFWQNGFSGGLEMMKKFPGRRDFWIIPFVAVIIFSSLITSFFTNIQAIVDSLYFYLNNISRASGGTPHENPWWFYLSLFAGQSEGSAPFRSDLWLGAGAAAGIFFLFRGKSALTPGRIFMLTAGISSFASLIFFSILPYKTPWSILCVTTGLIFPAVWLVETGKGRTAKIILWSAAVLFILHSVWQIYADNFKNYDNPSNPLVYSHPQEDVRIISDKVHDIFGKMKGEEGFYIDIIVGKNEYWPMPWYLRDISRSGWFDRVQENVPAAPFILAQTTDPDLGRKLYEVPPPGERYLYITLFDEYLELRPGVKVNLFLRKDWFDRYVKSE